MSGSINIVSSESRSSWMHALEQMIGYDFYHLPFYHDLARGLGEGEPRLLIYINGQYQILLPILLRKIQNVPQRFDDGQPWYDATSVYGYPGPIASHADIPMDIVSDFHEQLAATFHEMRVVSIFSRLHPLLEQTNLLGGVGTMVQQGQTVSIDLTVSESAQLAQYRENHRRDIRKLREMGARAVVDTEFRHLETFVSQYSETMDRVGAWKSYKFPARYFKQFVEAGEADVVLLGCEVGGEILGSGLFVMCRGILEYHLGGATLAGQRVGAMKLVLDAARHWGFEHGAKVFHLGGGVGSRDDSLAKFKLGFSRRSHSFCTWQWIIRQDVYAGLEDSWKAELQTKGLRIDPTFFPAYRAPELGGETDDTSRSAVEVMAPNNDGYQRVDRGVVERGTSMKADRTGGSMNTGGMKKRLIILGAGGHARVIADAVLSRQARGGGYELLGYLDDDRHLRNQKVLGKPVLGALAELRQFPHDAVIIGIGDNETRARLFQELRNRGEVFATVIHPQAILAHDVKIGRGSVAFAGVIVNTGSAIGENVILNTGCSVDHNCTVGSHAHVCPGTSLGGGVTVGEGAFLGINSTIIHSKQIGPWATIGGGASVIRDIPAHVTAVGVPARVLPPRSGAHKADTRDLVSEHIERTESMREYQ